MRMLVCVMMFVLPLCLWGQRSSELSAKKQQSIDSMVGVALGDRIFPGASVVVGSTDGVLFTKDYGHLDYDDGEAVSVNTLYDIASCTKVLSTTFVAMRLYDQGVLKIDDKLGSLARFEDSPLASISVGELMTHTSGISYRSLYPALVSNEIKGKPLMMAVKDDNYPYHVDNGLYMARDVVVKEELSGGNSIDSIISLLSEKAYVSANRGRYTYTDANFHLLKLIIESKSGRSLEEMSKELMDEINCLKTGYNPLNWSSPADIAPTEYDYLLRRGQIRGTPHDEIAALCEGIGGNAGMFSTSRDMAKFCELILNKGVCEGRVVIEPSTIELFTSSPVKNKGVYRGYGFDKRYAGSLGGEWRCGHTGYTGTMFWMDMKEGIYMVFLSNSVYPSRVGNKLQSSQLRTKIWSVIIGS